MIEKGRGGSHARTIRGLVAVLLCLPVAAAPAIAEGEGEPSSAPEAASPETDADALAEQEAQALERAEEEMASEDQRGIDPEAEAAEDPAAKPEPDVPPPAPPLDEAQTSAPWAPPGPDESAFDWIQTTSGEWLKGEFERLRDREVDFDSDEFDRQSIDWKDVAYFRFSTPHTFRFEGRRILWGPAEMRQGVIKVRTSDGVKEFPRREVVSITRGADGAEIDYWSVLVAVGTGVRQGNTKQADFSGRGSIMRETALTRLKFDYDGAYSRVDGNTATNVHRASTNFDVFLTRRFFVTIPFLLFLKDLNQRIEQQYTPGAGIGYELINNDWIESDTTLGSGVQHTRYDTGNTDLDAAVAYAIETELDLAYDVEWDSSYTLQLIPTDIGKTNHHAKSVLSFDIWDPIDLDLVFNWDRVEQPESSDDQSTPKSDDFRLSVEIAIDW